MGIKAFRTNLSVISLIAWDVDRHAEVQFTKNDFSFRKPMGIGHRCEKLKMINRLQNYFKFMI
jgi:hypothetical protein